MPDVSIIAEIETAFASGSADRQAQIARRVTDLFLANASSCSEQQVTLFDGVISRLAGRIETKARAELSARLAAGDRAPAMTAQTLARDASIEVAGPMLRASTRLTDDDLINISESRSQERLLAISKRTTVSERVSDVLVTHGNREVVLSVTENEGARFSDAGFGKLVDRSIDDEVLAVCVAMRKDVPRAHFQSLIARASKVVFEKLAASNPDAVYEVHKVLVDITGEEAAAAPVPGRDYRSAAAQFDVARRSGKPVDEIVQEAAAAGRFEDTVAALAALCRVPIKLVESVMNDPRPQTDFALILIKAAGLSWPTAKQICILRRKAFELSPDLVEATRENFERLQLKIAQHLIRFYKERYSAVADLEELAQQIQSRDADALSAAS